MLSIIVTHYKSPQYLKICLDDLQRHSPRGSEFIVSDSETTESTRAMMASDFPAVTFLETETNVGFAKLVNRALLEARGDFFLILNADIIVPNSAAIPKMLAYLKASPTVGMLGPRILNLDGSHQPSCFRFYAPLTVLARRTWLGKTAWGKKELARFLIPSSYGSMQPMVKAFPVDWLMGSALLVRRAAYERAGGLDERYFMYFEDLDWCRSFWEKNWQVLYYPEAFFYHHHGRASKKRGVFLDLLMNRYTRIHFMSALKYFKKYGFSVPRYGV